MPNHWHFVVKSQTDTQLTEFPLTKPSLSPRHLPVTHLPVHFQRQLSDRKMGDRKVGRMEVTCSYPSPPFDFNSNIRYARREGRTRSDKSANNEPRPPCSVQVLWCNASQRRTVCHGVPRNSNRQFVLDVFLRSFL